MLKKHKNSSLDCYLNQIADFLVEDYRFSRVFYSIIGKVSFEEQKKYESSLLFHKNKIADLINQYGISVRVFDGQNYDEGLPITPLNADEFENIDNLIVVQTIEPTILSKDGNTLHQGTVLLSKKND